MDRATTWHVGAILKEPLHVTLGFVSWFLDSGADRITVLFDDPSDPAIPVLASEPRVHAIACDDTFWRSIKMKPTARFVRRQNHAMTWLYHQCEADWFLNIDGDELVYIPEGDVRGMLDAQPDHVLSLRVLTAETVCLTETGGHAFRMQMGNKQRRRVYGADADLFPTGRNGLLGHADGKSFTRTGIEGLKLRQHWPVQPDKTNLPQKRLSAEQGVHLLHCIGDDYDQWRSKVEWRSGSHGFPENLKPLVTEILAAPDREPRLRDLYERLHCADEERVQAMTREGVLLQYQPDLTQRAQRRFGPFLGSGEAN